MSNIEGPEARELSLVGKVEMRIALANDASLSKTLNTYLAPLLLKLASEFVSVRKKVSSNTFLQATSLEIWRLKFLSISQTSWTLIVRGEIDKAECLLQRQSFLSILFQWCHKGCESLQMLLMLAANFPAMHFGRHNCWSS